MDMSEINKLLGFDSTYYNDNSNNKPPIGVPPGVPPPIIHGDNNYKIYFQFNNNEPIVWMEGFDINSMFTLNMNPKQMLDQGPFLQFREGNNVFKLLCRKN